MKTPEKTHSDSARIAMHDIRAILTRHDLMGLILIQDKQHAEYGFHFEPSWSQLKKAGDRAILQIRKDRHEQSEQTVGALISLQRLTAMYLRGFVDIVKSANNHCVIEYSEKHTPDYGIPPESCL